jgi:meso-butanediol dehydrogenase/(S,S)-butanediol dehydrogenase/diacetyl reductase
MSGGVHDGRVAIVTGGASGIGRAAVDALVAGGAQVVAVDLQVDGVAESDAIATLAGDVTDPDTNAAAVALAMERFGRLDAVAFNAGVPMSGDLMDLPIEQFDRCLEVNVRAVVIGLRAVVPALRARGVGGSPSPHPPRVSPAIPTCGPTTRPRQPRSTWSAARPSNWPAMPSR